MNIDNVELVDKLRTNGYSEIVDALLSEECYVKRNGRVNLTALARRLGISAETAGARVQQMVEVVAEFSE